MTASQDRRSSCLAYVVRARGDAATGGPERLSQAELPEVRAPSVTIEVEYSSLNYKDALACRGEKGVAPRLPHVPGIDCAGTVLASDSGDFAAGGPVLITGYDLGAPDWGGYSEVVSVPSEWVVPMPEGLDPRTAMIYGTAGFTAAQCVMAVADKVSPESGPVAVTGATGGVGVFATAILAKIGYRVVAVSGKPEMADRLMELGAAEVVGREALSDETGRPLLKAEWAGAVDTVGGAPLSALLRSTQHRGVVAACGLVAGADLPITVFPFLLRGVTLAGIDSAKCPRAPRLEVWRRLAGEWRVDLPESLVTTVTLDGVTDRAAEVLAGRAYGRTLVRPTSELG